MRLYEAEFDRIEQLIGELVTNSHARLAFLIDRNGQLIAASGDLEDVDTTSLASLTAGNMASAGGLAKLLQEDGFATQSHEGDHSRVTIQHVGAGRAILVVVFDDKTSMGLVRLRVLKTSEGLKKIFDAVDAQHQADRGQGAKAATVTDEEIDSLFD